MPSVCNCYFGLSRDRQKLFVDLHCSEYISYKDFIGILVHEIQNLDKSMYKNYFRVNYMDHFLEFIFKIECLEII